MSKMHSAMRQNNGGMAGGAWKNKKRLARKLVKRREERRWRKDLTD